MEGNKYIVEQELVDPKSLIEFAWKNYELYNNSQQMLEKLLNKKEANLDLRVWIFEIIKSTIQNHLLTFIFVTENLSKIDWWQNNKYLETKDLTIDQMREALGVYVNEGKINLIFTVFKHLEVFLRDLARYFSLFDNVDKAKFHQLRDRLIHFTGISNSYADLLKLYQLVRNSYHNNGFHFDKSEKIIYKNNEYSFIHEEPVNFLSIEFLSFLLEEINQFLLDIVQSEKVSNPYEIEGLIHKVIFKKKN